MNKIFTYALFIVFLITPSCSESDNTVTPVLYDFSPASSASSGSVTLQKNSVAGDVVIVDVLVTGVNGVFSADIKLEYDSSQVRWGGYKVKGNFLELNGSVPTYNVKLYNGIEGKLVIGASLIAPDGEVSGSGTLLSLPFKVLGSGSWAVSFSDSKLTDSTAPIPNEIPVSWYGGTITGY